MCAKKAAEDARGHQIITSSYVLSNLEATKMIKLVSRMIRKLPWQISVSHHLIQTGNYKIP